MMIHNAPFVQSYARGTDNATLAYIGLAGHNVFMSVCVGCTTNSSDHKEMSAETSVVIFLVPPHKDPLIWQAR